MSAPRETLSAPTPPTRTRIEATGSIVVLASAATFGCSIHLDFDRFGGDAIDGRLIVENDVDIRTSAQVLRTLRQGFRFRSSHPGAFEIDFGWSSRLQLKGRFITFAPSSFTVHDGDSSMASGDEILLRASLAGSPQLRALGVEESSLEGGITFTPIYDGLIAWPSPLGGFTALERYEHLPCQAGPHDGTTQVRVPSIEATVRVPPASTFQDCMDGFAKEVEAASTLLSLFNRRNVGWYRISGCSAGGERRIRTLERWQTFVSRAVSRNSNRGTLVDHQVLVGGAFAPIRTAFATEDPNGIIARTIWLLVASWDQSILYTKSLLIHTAFETIVGRFATKGAGAKRRRRLLDDAIHAVRQSGVKHDDLWPRDDEGLERGLRRVILNRNALVHEGRIADLDNIRDDMIRQRVLCERLVLRSLGCPDAMLSPWHADEVQLANQARS